MYRPHPDTHTPVHARSSHISRLLVARCKKDCFNYLTTIETRHLKLIPLPKKAKAPTDINDSLSNRWYQLQLAVPATFLISFELFPTHYFQLFSVMPVLIGGLLL
ncbi:hypothetical protein BDZ91DRAFT_292174 [Kalaharituber pfeilii]|nr:hypothetical protein BDZ91DRAFT_292174 [Kalaharituber pfeilii]